jgi:hypothetical protein
MLPAGATLARTDMLLIRREQIAALAADRDLRLAADLKDKVVEALPVLRSVLDEATIARVVREAVAQARGFGLETDQEIGELVGLVFACGERFFEREEYAWAAELLRSSSPTRVRQVSDGVVRRLDRRLAAAGGGAR